MWMNRGARDRREHTLTEKIDELEKNNADLKRENEYLREQILNYENVIGEVKNAEAQYNKAIDDAREISLKYKEAMEEVKAMKEKYKSDFDGLIKRLRNT